MAGGFRSFDRADKFRSDFKGLTEQQQADVEACILDLLKDPIPKVRRFHCVDKNRPKIFTVDVYSNKSYKISFQIDDGVLLLRRVATHKQIDSNP